MDKNLIKFINNWNHDKINLVGPLNTKQELLEGPILYIDGGVKHQEKFGAGFSLGDEDSSNSPLDLCLPTEKDYSDFAFALRYLKEFKQIDCYGFTGGRLDHQLAILGDINQYLETSNLCEVKLDDQIIGTNKKTVCLNYHGTFSIFSFHENYFSIQGEVKYQAEKILTKPFSSYTLSNIGKGVFYIEGSEPFFIFFSAI